MNAGRPHGPERSGGVAERTLATRRIYDGNIVSLRVDEVETDDGRRATREVVEHPGAVAMLPWDGSHLTLVRQWRHAAGGELLELPAGTIDPGESPLETAQRELREETGLAAASWEEGPGFFTAPGFCTEHLRLFLATDLHEPDAGVDERPSDESIEVSRVGLDEALSAIEDGSIADAKSIAGILWLARRVAAER